MIRDLDDNIYSSCRRMPHVLTKTRKKQIQNKMYWLPQHTPPFKTRIPSGYLTNLLPNLVVHLSCVHSTSASNIHPFTAANYETSVKLWGDKFQKLYNYMLTIFRAPCISELNLISLHGCDNTRNWLTNICTGVTHTSTFVLVPDRIWRIHKNEVNWQFFFLLS